MRTEDRRDEIKSNPFTSPDSERKNRLDKIFVNLSERADSAVCEVEGVYLRLVVVTVIPQ